MIKLLIIKKTEKKILNKAKKYYEDNKKVLKEKTRNKYRELSEEEKNIKRKHGKNKYHNMSQGNKQRLKEYQKNYRDARNFKKNLNLAVSIKIK